MRLRECIAYALLAAVVCASTAGLAAYKAGQSSERASSMNLNDTLEQRLYQMVNASAAVSPSAGVGATASVNGNDAIGQINITTGANPTPGTLVHVTFAAEYQTQPIIQASPLDQAPPPDWYLQIDQEGFNIAVGVAPAPNTNYPFTYFVAVRPWLMYLTPAPAPQP
jgi:hypothetical protein